MLKYINKNVTSLDNIFKLKKDKVLYKIIFYKFIYAEIIKKYIFYTKLKIVQNYAKLNVYNNTVYSVNFIKNLKSKWAINFISTTFNKYIKNFNSNKFNIFFLRKNKIFNKGRYSRNRQNYRTGVYWCIALNIILVVALYIWFYRFSMNYTYIWWFFFFCIALFFISRISQYRLYNILNIKNEFICTFNWFFRIILNLIEITKITLKNFNINAHLNINNFLKVLLFIF